MEGSRTRRKRMVEQQLASRGVRDSRVLAAMGAVPREEFVAPRMVELAYDDTALPIDEGQTISQPYIVALMAEALELKPEDRVLDIGTGSGYAAAVLDHVAAEVFTVERHRSLAEAARQRFAALGMNGIRVHVGDGTLGWEEHAPYDAIQVAAGGPDVPPALLEQLAPGGRLVMPTGETRGLQKLVRIRRTEDGTRRENLGGVRFVPLVGVAGWSEEGERRAPAAAAEDGGEASAARRSGPRGDGDRPSTDPAARDRENARASAASRHRPTGVTGAGPPESVPDRIRRAAEPFGLIETAPVEGLLDRIGDARVVLLGESTHGTSEFYRMRTRITRALVERRGFDIVAVEADWPDAATIDDFVRLHETVPGSRMPFSRFPTWMWANEEVRHLVHGLRARNGTVDVEDRVGFHGLDLYSLSASLEHVLSYLEDVDPEAAEAARTRYGCLTPWGSDAASYGRAVLSGRYESCEPEVVRQLSDLLEHRLEYEEKAGRRRAFHAEQNARLVANAERYYRIMYYGGRESWNLRDQHMFDTLEALLAHHGPGSRAVVWAHNSHLGDASATEMRARGEHNVGQLARQRWGDEAYLVGFGTHAGTVAASHDWGEPMRVMDVRPSLGGSYERLSHDAELDRFLLPLRKRDAPEVRASLRPERLERAIGVIYRPETELASHYFRASLPRQFDEWIWFDESRAVSPLGVAADEKLTPETFPFAV